MTSRTVYIIAALVTKAPTETIATTLGELLAESFQPFQIHRTPSLDGALAAQGFEVCAMGFVVLTGERLNVIADRAQAFANDPGNIGINMQMMEVPLADAAAFWREVQGDGWAVEAACAKMAWMFPWDTGHGVDASVAFNAPRGDA